MKRNCELYAALQQRRTMARVAVATKPQSGAYRVTRRLGRQLPSQAAMALISTRLHGIIDYTVSACFTALTRSRRLPLPVRGVLRSAAAYHAGYSALTDYEAGLRPVIGMRTHLALDTLGALA